jgi:putative membrane protein
MATANSGRLPPPELLMRNKRFLKAITLAAIGATTVGVLSASASSDSSRTAAGAAFDHAALNDPAIAPGHAAIALDDATIVAIFDGANTADLETGLLAAKQGSSAEVREFGAMLARDHEGVRKMGRDLAAKLKVTPTPPANDPAVKAHNEAMTKLRSLKGAAFDHAFLQHEVAFHKSVIEAVQTTLLPAIQNAELKALVVKVAPAFQAHMMAAEQLDKKLSKAEPDAAARH